MNPPSDSKWKPEQPWISCLMVRNTQLSPEEIASSWNGKFHYKKAIEATETTAEVAGLRAPQIGALHSILAHLECGENESGIVVMPTGTGKTETMLSFLVENRCVHTLVIVPSDALRSQLGKKYATLGILKKIGVVDEDTLLPKVKLITGKKSLSEWKTIVKENNVVVATMASMSRIDRYCIDYLSSVFDYLIVDEAHHSQASTWLNFISCFPKKNVMLFTATPFRNDGKKLDGRIIFNYSLRNAQKDDYYKEINFCPISSYNKGEGDKLIANKAVEVLRADLAEGYNHILMARCKDHKRAEEVFEIYRNYEDLNPVLIHSGTPNKKDVMRRINNLEHKIVVCVNMLGEGYDLPQLKIAAIHDERQSLPITLQFIGRFTRKSEDIGKASFVTNIALAPIQEEIAQLYQRDADWNYLLPRVSDGRTQEERDANEFMRDFKGALTEEFSIDDIHPALSAEIYSCVDRTTAFCNWEKGLTNPAIYQYKRSAQTTDMLVIALGKSSIVDWGSFDSISNLTWDLIVVYFDAINRRIYLNSTMDIRGEKFLEPMFGTVTKVDGERVFRIFADIRRLMLTNVGTRRPHGRDISFQSFFGSSVEDGLSALTEGKLSKNNVFGIGFRDGSKCSAGCSVKGKLWSRDRANLFTFKKWCNHVGALISNESIDENFVLKNTLKHYAVKKYPLDTVPLGFDWPTEVFENGVLLVKYLNHAIPYDDFSVTIDTKSSNEDSMFLHFECEEFAFRVIAKINDTGVSYDIIAPLDKAVILARGRSEYTVDDFFNRFTPKVFYSDGSVLYGNHMVDHPLHTPQFDTSKLIDIDWGNTKLEQESQYSKQGDFRPESIQAVYAQKIKDDYQILIDDDGSGEVADLIGINIIDNAIDITLHHLKFAIGGKVSENINNLYQVCGQAIKSIRWKYSQCHSIFDSILRRNERKLSTRKPSSIIKGTQRDVEKMKEQALNKRELRFHVVIVQPGMSKSKCSEEMLILIGNVQQYLMEVSSIDLKIVCSK